MNYEATISDSSDDLYLTEEERMARSRKRWIIGAVLAVILLAISAWFVVAGGEETGGAGSAAGRANQAATVTVTVPGRDQVEQIINASGTLAARRPLPVGVAGEGGQVVRVLVQPGDWVRQGQVLAVIDQSVQNQQIQSQAAQVEVAAADAALAQSNLDRALQLVDRGFISKADVDRLTATRDAASARVKVAQAQLAELRARSGRLNIRAPSSGLVLERNVDPGQVVGGGSGTLFSLASGGEMELRAELSEADLAALSVGVRATVRPVGSEEEFEGQVWQISPTVEQNTRQGIARIALSYDPALRPGGFASARIVGGQSEAPVLPESAVMSDEQGSFVYIVDGDGKVVRRDVRTGIVTPAGITIVESITGSEQIVLYAGGFLNPGEAVNVVRQGENN